jgi:hypothetical protein
MKPRISLGVLTLLFSAGILSPIPTRGQQLACSAPEYSQFDFWIGSWRVESGTSGKTAGHNTITKDHGGCVLHESYTTPTGYSGESFNIYDRSRGVWHQTWVDSTGLLLQLEGHFSDGRIVLEGPGVDARGNPLVHRITWNVIAGDRDRVSQHWQTSTDGGTTWSTAFQGTYLRDPDVGLP